MSTLRIATWNIKRPETCLDISDQAREMMEKINADIWILTQGNRSLNPGPGYVCVYSDPMAYGSAASDYCSAIWSRYPIKWTLPVAQPDLAICAEIDSPLGSLVVYGTALPAQTRTSQTPQTHPYLALEQQRNDWASWGADLPLCVAGDFSEVLHPEYDDHEKGRELLQHAWQDSQLTCVTAMEALEYSMAHICISQSWAPRITSVARSGAAENWADSYSSSFIDLTDDSDLACN